MTKLENGNVSFQSPMRMCLVNLATFESELMTAVRFFAEAVFVSVKLRFRFFPLIVVSNFMVF